VDLEEYRIDEPGVPVSCGTYRRGHDPHVIQVRLAWNETDPCDVARLVDRCAVDPDGRITVDLDGRRWDFWNHRPDRILRALDRAGDTLVEVSVRWRLLKVYRPDLSGSWVFTLGEEPSPCGSRRPS
jgi:hypothetical protein